MRVVKGEDLLKEGDSYPMVRRSGGEGGDIDISLVWKSSILFYATIYFRLG